MRLASHKRSFVFLMATYFVVPLEGLQPPGYAIVYPSPVAQRVPTWGLRRGYRHFGGTLHTKNVYSFSMYSFGTFHIGNTRGRHECHIGVCASAPSRSYATAPPPPRLRHCLLLGKLCHRSVDDDSPGSQFLNFQHWRQLSFFYHGRLLAIRAWSRPNCHTSMLNFYVDLYIFGMTGGDTRG